MQKLKYLKTTTFFGMLALTVIIFMLALESENDPLIITQEAAVPKRAEFP